MVMRLVQITDTHIFADPRAEFDGVQTASTLALVAARIRERETVCDALLVTGDLVHDPSPAAYRQFYTLLQHFDIPVFCLAGNHDSPQMMRSILLPLGLRIETQVPLRRWMLLFLATHIPEQPGGRVAESELRTLDHTLSAAGGQHVLICMHHPPVAIDSPWMDAMGLQNKAALWRVLARHEHVRGIIWGHIHQEFSGAQGDIVLLGTPSTCVQFRPRASRYIKDSLAPAYRRLALRDDGTIESGVEYLSHDLS